MATPAEQAATLARTTEEKLNSKLSDKSASHAEIAALLQEYRIACERAIFSDFKYASDQRIEANLWNAHSRVNTNFRKQLSKLNRESKNRAVEIRVLIKQYLVFIKSSQRFYREYILHLDAVFGGIPELRRIAKSWKTNGSNGAPSKHISPELRTLVLTSTYQTLIQLGDLSRYREAETGGKDRNWAHAVGYYQVATTIYPASGISHNQQAVIALADGNHFRATYHLYRSLSAKEPHPLAKGNLELEFKKVIAAWDKGEPLKKQPSREGNGAHAILTAWFVRLHSKCYKGEEFQQHDELESEVLSQLAVELKERSLEGLLQKFVLVNVAAEYFKSVQLAAGHTSPQDFRSYFFFLRFNVKTLFTLLQVLQPELELLTSDDASSGPDARPLHLSDKVTPVARRVLPGLRLYSSWLLKTWRLLVADIEGSVSKVEVQELWKAYAETLTLLVSAFPVEQLPSENYMLEEDVDTIGFEPLLDEATERTWYTSTNSKEMKPKWSDDDVERNHPNVEMVMRIRDFIVDGLHLTQNDDAPLALDGMRFIYKEPGLPRQPVASPDRQPEPVLDPIEIPRGQLKRTLTDDQMSYGVAPSESASVTKDKAMNRMVNDLLGSDDGMDPLPEEDENIPPTPPEQTFEDTALINDGSYGINPLNAGDLVNMVRNYSSQPSCASENHNFPHATASPAVRNLPTLPSLPDHSGIWSENYGAFAPSTPILPPGLNLRNSPFGRQSLSHSRNVSVNSSWSPMPAAPPITTPDGGSVCSYDPTPIGSAGGVAPPTYSNGKAPAGVAAHGLYGHGHGFNGNAYDVGMRSPLLFGGGTWGTDMSRRSSSFHKTPPNGQAG
ncbi:hypothetical protein K490DRAFT_76107 [Saccharata proteae CBS 121410]|uniref:Protein SMG7 n=1 Tax=Saccharata proteae CBS 121410 TaxID=1314787 RepID=A0A9P4HNI6_9PEZI|nr:hypothetical protein K490DRAFT_76107 [Saccharata proteae CBS 121410]